MQLKLLKNLELLGLNNIVIMDVIKILFIFKAKIIMYKNLQNSSFLCYFSY